MNTTNSSKDHAFGGARAALACALLVGARVAAQDIGVEGPSYSGANAFPSGTKPESKLWFNDGGWWGCLWSAATQRYSIHELEPDAQTWLDTGIAIDARGLSRADCLWNGSELYVASHRYDAGGGTTGHPLVVFRYGYDPVSRSYSLDPGFPVQVADSSAETAVIDQDSRGVLWVVWLRNLRLRMTHTLGDDHTWSAPVIHPRNASAVATDDVSSVVHFDGDKLGVVWSDQVLGTYWFSYHVDGDADNVWSPAETLLPGLGDDHINLKAAGDGRLFAVLKTSTDEIRLEVRETNGAWSDHLVSSAADGWTRAVCALDEDARLVHVFATSPVVAGTIYEKSTAYDALTFAPGLGTAVIYKPSDPSHNDSTTTKQSVGRESGVVVLATHQPSQRYWHHFDALGAPPATAPLARAVAVPSSGYAALTVHFQDESRNAPDAWFWSFGDGATSSERHPVHTYALPGSYTVTLEASNGFGTDTFELPSAITVVPPPTALTLTALQDAQLRQAAPDSNFGALDTLRVRQDPSSDFRSLIAFQVPASSYQVVSARLRLFVTDPGPDGGTVYALAPAWQEPFVTWNNAPAFGGAPLGNLGIAVNNTWVELDVTPAVSSGARVTFGLRNASSNSVFYSSREGAHPPELVLTLQPPAPVASFGSSSPSGPAPLAVSFTDTSSGFPSAWLWDFGDGASSTEPSPPHVYAVPGTYTVALTVANVSGSDTQTRIDYVHVAEPPPPAPVASFSSSTPSGPTPLAVSFTDTSSGPPSAWTWDFGDGASSTEPNPLHVYTVPGTYTVALTVRNVSGSDTVTLVDYVQADEPPPPAPVAAFTVNSTRGHAPFAVAFTDTSGGAPTSWSWDFGDGTTSTLANPAHVYPTPGTYTVRLTVANAGGSDTVVRSDLVRVLFRKTRRR